MLSLTTQALEKFDNSHDFERMCADILNSLGNGDVTLIAPRGGGDGAKDITYTNSSGEKSLACVSLRKDAKTKFFSDLKDRSKDDYSEYTFFTNQYITAAEKLKFTLYCAEDLEATLVCRDIESLRSLLDTTFQNLRSDYLNIQPDATPDYSFKLTHLRKYSVSGLITEAEEVLANTKAKFQKHSQVSYAIPISLPAIGVESTHEVLDRLSSHIAELEEVEESLQNKYSFNLEVISTKYDENIQINVDSSDGNPFEFDPEYLVIPPKPTDYQQSNFDKILHVSTDFGIGNVHAPDKSEFYARITNNGKSIKSNLSIINPSQPKVLFDEKAFISKLSDEFDQELKISVFSKFMKEPQITEFKLDLKNAETQQLGYN